MIAIFLFYTTSAAFRAEKALKEARMEARLIPTPRQFSSDCGISLEVGWSQVDRARTLLDRAGVEYSAVREMTS